MEVRKLQTTAAGTFIVTLPKEWTQNLGLKKGDLVNIELEDHDIVISATNAKQDTQSKSMSIDEFREQKLLELCVTASYLSLIHI